MPVGGGDQAYQAQLIQAGYLVQENHFYYRTVSTSGIWIPPFPFLAELVFDTRGRGLPMAFGASSA